LTIARAELLPAWIIFSVATLPVCIHCLMRREQLPSDFHQALPFGGGAAASACPPRRLTGGSTSLVVELNATLRLDDRLADLLFLRFRLGQQMMLFDAAGELCGWLDPGWRQLHPA
jgi:hypothetical protein